MQLEGLNSDSPVARNSSVLAVQEDTPLNSPTAALFKYAASGRRNLGQIRKQT
jgi:hypothetical protein